MATHATSSLAVRIPCPSPVFSGEPFLGRPGASWRRRSSVSNTPLCRSHPMFRTRHLDSYPSRGKRPRPSSPVTCRRLPSLMAGRTWRVRRVSGGVALARSVARSARRRGVMGDCGTHGQVGRRRCRRDRVRHRRAGPRAWLRQRDRRRARRPPRRPAGRAPHRRERRTRRQRASRRALENAGFALVTGTNETASYARCERRPARCFGLGLGLVRA